MNQILGAIVRAGRKVQKHIAQAKRANSLSFREAVWKLLPAAYELVSENGTYPANVRQLMYAMRPAMLKLAGKDRVNDKYITQGLIPDFVEEHPELTAGWRIAFDKRGTLHEPHTGATVDLGTIEVDAFLKARGNRLEYKRNVTSQDFHDCDPEDRFGGLLYVEKEGFNALILESGVLERYDLCLASNKGMSVTALRTLIDEMMARDARFTVYTLSDFDITGSIIRETLTGDTRRYTYANRVNVVPLGVTWEQAEELHYAGRSEPSGKADAAAYWDKLASHGHSTTALSFLCDEGGLRVELNALRPRRLLDMIWAGIEAAPTEKVVPDDDLLAAAYRRSVVLGQLRKVEAELAKQSIEVPANLRESVLRALADDPTPSWDQDVASELPGGESL